MLTLVLGIGGGGYLGLPPGERSVKLVQAAPADAVLYTEWSSRSTGTPGAPGIDGFAADPEVRALLADIRKVILAAVKQETSDGIAEEQLLGETLPPLIETLLMQPGCLYLNLNEQAAAEEFVPLPQAVRAALSGALVIDGGKQADAIAAQLTELLTLLPPVDQQEDKPGAPRGPLDHIALPLPPQLPPVSLHRHEQFFILGIGAGTVDRVIQGLTGDGTGQLGTQQRFVQAMKHTALERTGGVSWFDVRTLLTRLPATVGPPGALAGAAAVTLGFDEIDSLISVTGVKDGVICTRSHMATSGSRKGILSLTGGRGITAADLSHIPADADVVTAFSLNLTEILAATRKMIGQVDQESLKNFEMLLSSLEQETGIELEDQLLKAFGDVWTLHNAPSNGGPLFAGAIASLEVRDQEQSQKVFSQAMSILEKVLPGIVQSRYRVHGVTLKQKRFLDHEIYCIIPVGDDDVPFALSFCLTENHLLAAMHPQPLKAELRFLADQDQQKSPTFAARFSEIAARQPGEVLQFSWFDTPALTKLFYSSAPFLAQVLTSEMQGNRIELDAFSLPSSRALLPYVSPGSSITRRTETGLSIESEAGLPIPGVFGLPANLFGAATFGFRVQTRQLIPAPQVIPAGRQQPARPANIRVQVRPAGARIRVRVQNAAPQKQQAP